MWCAVVISGVGFGVAAAYARRPSERTLMLMRPLSLGSVFSAIGSLTAGLATILKGAAATSDWGGRAFSRLLLRRADALISVIVAFRYHAVDLLLVAIVLRR